MIRFAHKLDKDQQIDNSDKQQQQQNEQNNENKQKFQKDNKNQQQQQQQQQEQQQNFTPNNKVENPMIANQILRSTDFISRYFTKYYKKQQDKQTSDNLDQYIYQHMNDLCLIGLAPNHVVVKNKLAIKKINFDCIYSGDLQQMTSGKRKCGSIKSSQNKKIAEIICENGQTYPVFGLIQGDIIELNQNIIENPQWVSENASDKGFLAIISVQNKKFINGLKNDKEVLKEEQYFQQI